MAQKALKTLAARNSATLNRTHQIALAINALYLVLRWTLFTRRLMPYILLNLPALVIEFWLERIGRPVYITVGGVPELKRAGEDLEAKGLTEWMWDVVYWTWLNIAIVTLLGDWAWWLYLVVPGYSIWLAFTTYSGLRNSLGGGGGGVPAAADGGSSAAGGQSKRQAKMEKRGGQKVQYR